MMPILSPMVSPYDYALLSEAAYFDEISESSILYQKGWQREVSVNDATGYCGSIWVHHEKRQIVIVHRGSQNATSWVTDIESVVQLKPGSFIHKAIALLNHDRVHEYKSQGYRLSTTGHSLGGFLAQVCVYWSQRSEFPETFYPDMSAMVFDSPGAVDFLNVLQYNPLSERVRIKIERLNIHNFCAMPTVVSTFGTQTGTLWHLSKEGSISFDFLNAHRMEHILAGFDTITGQPIRFRQMRDWPQADYSAYEGVESTVEHLASEAIKLPFSFLNAVYKYVKQRFGYLPTPTWYDQVLASPDGQVTSFHRITAEDLHQPALNDFNERLTLAIQAHYVTFSHEKHLMKTIHLYHFDKSIQAFLIELCQAKPWTEDLVIALQNHYSEVFSLLTFFEMFHEGNITEIQLNHDFTGTVFKFQTMLQQLLQEKGVFSVKQFFMEKREALEKKMAELTEDLEGMKEGSKVWGKTQDQLALLTEQFNRFSLQLNQFTGASDDDSADEYYLNNPAMAAAKGATAVRYTDEKETNAGIDRVIKLIPNLRTNRAAKIFDGGAIATEENGVAVVLSSQTRPADGVTDEVLKLVGGLREKLWNKGGNHSVVRNSSTTSNTFLEEDNRGLSKK